MASPGLSKRDEIPNFDKRAYYRFFNDNRPNKTLAFNDTDGSIDMFPSGVSTSKENWQIYSQQGRWFLRPYATASDQQWKDYQLGLNDTDGNVRAVPGPLNRSGELGQQWTFTKVDDEDGGVGYKISNGLLGNETWLSATNGDKERPDDGGRPVMQPGGSDGAIWRISINDPAGEPSMDNSYQDVSNFEVATSSSSLSLIAASSTSTPTAKPTSLPTTIPSQTSSGLSTGAKAGIGIGIAVFVLLAAVGAWLFFARRRKERGGGIYDIPELVAEPKTTYAYERGSMAQEMEQEPPRYELGNSGESRERRYELMEHGGR